MNKTLFFCLVGSCFFGSCSLLEMTEPDPIKGAGAITLKFVQVSDVSEITPLNGGKTGGLARVAHIRDSIKSKFPNTYLFMAGNFLSPSEMGDLLVDGEAANGKQMIEVMNAMDFDLVTFGEREFDYDEQELQKRLNESTFTWTSANVRHVTETGVEPFTTLWQFSKLPVSDYSTFTAIDPDGNKVKFSVFALTAPENKKSYVYYGDLLQEAERVYNLARPNVDFVFALTNASLEEDIAIAKHLRTLPMIMGSGNRNVLERVGKTLIAKADPQAASVFVHTLIYNLRTGYLHINSELFYIDEKIASEAKVQRIVNRWTALLEDSKNAD